MLSHSTRRGFLQSVAVGATWFSVPGAYAEELSLTPRQTEGPFYPDRLPLDTDNDLLILNDSITPAIGQITHLTGRVLSAAGEPIRNAVVEIWQADNEGVYIHTQSPKREELDGNFQGFGRFLTSSTGEYYFRTIKPVHYGPRTPHIHMAVNRGSKRMLTTECYINGDKDNDRDPVLGRLSEEEGKRLMVDFKPIPGSKTNELAAHFEIVLGSTPEERSQDRGRSRPPRR